MSLTVEQVEEIAALARLTLRPDEVARFQGQLSAILDYAERVQAVATEEVLLTSHATGLEGGMREDLIEGSLTQEEALANAPATEDGFVVVPAVLDEG